MALVFGMGMQVRGRAETFAWVFGVCHWGDTTRDVSKGQCLSTCGFGGS